MTVRRSTSRGVVCVAALSFEARVAGSAIIVDPASANVIDVGDMRPGSDAFVSLLFLLSWAASSAAALALPAIGNVCPRNLPRLATPTFHVSCVLYPEQSAPSSRHCEQYGLLLSQVT